MRLFVFVSVFVLGTAALAAAQGLEFGAKAGPAFATLRFDPDDEEQPHRRRISVDGGGFLVLPLGGRVGLQLEGLFTSRGATANAVENEEVTSKILLQYFELPALLRVNGPRVGSGSIYFFGGPYLAIRLSAKREFSVFINGQTTGTREDMSDEVEWLDAGVTFGAGVMVNRWIVIDGRYSHALKKLNSDTAAGFGIWNRAITFMAGVRF